MFVAEVSIEEVDLEESTKVVLPAVTGSKDAWDGTTGARTDGTSTVVDRAVDKAVLSVAVDMAVVGIAAPRWRLRRSSAPERSVASSQGGVGGKSDRARFKD